jgi:hypothetical protein
MIINYPLFKDTDKRFRIEANPAFNYFSGIRAPVAPTGYAIELRDRFGELKARLETHVSSVSWDWRAIGGCGQARLRIIGDYLRYEIQADDDIRIYYPINGTQELMYRGYVETVKPRLSSTESIDVSCMGYWGFLKRFIISDNGLEKEYLGNEITRTLRNILADFIFPKSPITLGTIDASVFSTDVLKFKGDVESAVMTLVDLVGTVECGVDENLQFYWHNQDFSIANRFYVGDHLTDFTDSIDYKGIVNKVYFEGGKVNGSAFQMVGESISSQKKFGVREDIISNGSITTTSVANTFMQGWFKKKNIPIRKASAKLVNINKRLENNKPFGGVAVVDKDSFQDRVYYGATVDGGSEVEYGKYRSGGDNKKYGTSSKYQIDHISYSVSEEDGKIDASIQFADHNLISESSAFLKRLELTSNANRQRSL